MPDNLQTNKQTGTTLQLGQLIYPRDDITMTSVQLRIYDLSQGMARTMSPALLGKQIDGIWHTGIVVYGREYYFGGGICADPPGTTPYGTPHSIEIMGATDKSQAEFRDFLGSISPNFTFATYHLLDNNCNNFSDQCCRFLVGKSIPQYILDLPSEAMNSPLGPMIRPVIEQMQSAIQQQSVGHEVQFQSSSTARAATSSPMPSATPSTSSIAGSRSRSYWSIPVTLQKGDRNVITSKLQEFVPEYKLGDGDFIDLSLSVPPQKSFPALDLMRLDVAEKESVAEKFVAQFRALATRFILNEDVPAPACMMTLRGAVNVFKHAAPTENFCRAEEIEVIVESIATALTKENAQIRKTGALLALNLAGAHRRHPQAPKLGEDHSVRLLFSMVERLSATETPAPEEAGPLLSALNVFVDGDADALVLVKTFGLDLEVYQNAKSCADAYTRTAASELAKLLSSG